MATCGLWAVYEVLIDWNNDGVYTGTNETVTADLTQVPLTWAYGRDQARALSPAGPGKANFSLTNANYVYSPGGSSPIAANVIPSRPTIIRVTANGNMPVTGFAGRASELGIHSERDQRNVDIVCIDALQWLSSVQVSTTLYQGLRSGDALNLILDSVGWPANLRNIDPGSSVFPWWWVDGIVASSAISDIVSSEGPGAICFVEGGIITYHDRNHRQTVAQSITNQGIYCVADSLGCVAPSPCVTGSFPYTDPFIYDHGLQNIINKASFSVGVRTPQTGDPVGVWSSGETYSMTAGQTISVHAQTTDPFQNAIAPIDGIDFITTIGSATCTLSQTSGSSTIINITAGASATTIENLTLRATPIVVGYTVQVGASDAASITKYGEQLFPDTCPWAGVADAQAIATLIVGQRSNLVPIVQIRTVNGTFADQEQMTLRKISDLITIRNDRLGVNTDFYVENIQHEVTGLGKKHAATYGCEQVVPPNAMTNNPANVFTFKGTATGGGGIVENAAAPTTNPTTGLGAGAGTLLTGTFSPPAGSHVIAMVGEGFSTSSGSITVTDSSDANVTNWTIVNRLGPSSSYGQAAVAYRYFAAAPGAISVRAAFGGSPFGKFIYIKTLTGVDQANPIGMTARFQRFDDIDYSKTVSPVSLGSYIAGMGNLNYQPLTTTFAATSLSTILGSFYNPTDDVGHVAFKQTALTSALNPRSLGFTASHDSDGSLVMVEFRSGTDTGGIGGSVGHRFDEGVFAW